MKKTILIICVWILLGFLFTKFILNRSVITNDEYTVYAFLIGTYEEENIAQNKASSLPSSIILKENNQYKIYAGMYKDIDLVNKMVVYFEDNNINIYLKTINTNRKFYEELDNYERVLESTTDSKVYNRVNQGILDRYVESYSV